jgi:hypothetical protein
MLVLTPDGLERRTLREILTANGGDEDDIKIGNEKYSFLIMQSDYDEEMQIGGKEGDIVFYDLVTYGYGETIDWDVLQEKKEELSAWADRVCPEHHCTYKIAVTANYW